MRSNLEFLLSQLVAKIMFVCLLYVFMFYYWWLCRICVYSLLVVLASYICVSCCWWGKCVLVCVYVYFVKCLCPFVFFSFSCAFMVNCDFLAPYEDIVRFKCGGGKVMYHFFHIFCEHFSIFAYVFRGFEDFYCFWICFNL